MKRFITYLYEYQGGKKGKNTGFIRVDERNGFVTMQVSVRNLIHSHGKGSAYLFVKDFGLKELELGEISVMNGQADARYQFVSHDVVNSGYRLTDVVGVGIYLPANVYLASCWKDEAAEEIGHGACNKLSHEDMTEIISKKEEALEEEAVLDRKVLREAEFLDDLREQETTDVVTYQKMELNQIRTLPSKNWYLCNNRFLIHGFWNYKYLVLKKKSSSAEEVVYLGVPGVFEKPEMVMATLFGFPEFEALPLEVSEAQMNQEVSLEEVCDSNKKSQEPKTGTFGCWLIPLHV